MDNIRMLIVCVVVSIGMLFTACRHSAGDVSDYNVEVYSPSYASGLKILGAEGMNSTIIQSSNPWQGADGVTRSLFIQRDDEPIPSGFVGEVLKGDAARIVAMSSTQIAMLSALDADSLVVGVSGIGYISNPNIRKRSNELVDVGFEGNINYELMLSANPDVVLLYGVGGASSLESKLNELGIPYVYIGEYLEESPLGKAEWMVAIAEIIGRRDRGEALFADIPKQYNKLKAIADSAANISKVRVMINAPYGDAWFMPSNESYMVQLIRDAGGNYMYENNTGNSSEPVDMEMAYKLASECDVWLNAGAFATIADLQTAMPKFADLPVVKSANIYNNDLRSTTSGGNDFYESGTVMPHKVLSDLILIFHPKALPDSVTSYFYRRIK